MTTPIDTLRDLQRHDYAFPFEVTTEDGKASYFCAGMKLRDYLAAHALEKCPLNMPSDIAKWCYEVADAMIRARGPK